jgi:hypothetical protein
MSLKMDAVCAPSEDIVYREIEGEVILVPLVAGIGDAEDELYTLNATGRAVWERLDGVRTRNIPLRPMPSPPTSSVSSRRCSGGRC